MLSVDVAASENIPTGGFEFTVYYDRDIVTLSAAEGPYLSSTGRQTQCQQIVTETSIRMGCTSTGSQPGPTGAGTVAYLTLTPNVTIRPTLGNGIQTTIALTAAELSDDLGVPILVDELGVSTILVRALEGDVNKDCRVDVIDEQSEAGRYGTTIGLWPYDLWFDLEPPNGDYDIDIKDLQFVYGRDRWTCEGEQPPPEPTYTPTATSPPTNTPTVTITPMPRTQTPTATPVSPSVTPTVTETPPPTQTPTPTVPTATSTAGPSPTATTATATATAVSPSQTPSTPANTSTPGPATATSVPVSATSTPQSRISPAERTPTPETTRIATALPGSGSGGNSGGTSGGTLILLLTALLAVVGWTAVAGTKWANGGLAIGLVERLRSIARGRWSRR
ncbi:MAG: hypothetical protein ABSC13_02870 [Dehalococcoidia bacterium]